ncbi:MULTISPECIES: gamma-mobile-trio recombinase GmtY [Aeromonas]|uniref:gamma-mobile-trio recombinase GmtY n=1 Tax=Aeromonas TaxID=642 RepID=UPI0025B6F7EB|nr:MULTISPECIES: gamma-mobile-trio recombinase GmtY [Aeromonas]MDO2952873.1 gamma-mobile-trio recombinase GmtY [Aeromonas simiae]
MFATKVTAKVVQDNSGVTTEIPVILTDQGVLGSVTDYVLSLHLNGTSLSTITNHIQSIRLLIEFMDANEGMFHDPEELFAGFVRRLYSGTIGEDGFDPSGLYWIPASTGTINRHIGNLTNFTNWLSDKGLAKPLNTLRTATRHEERIQYAAWFRRNQNDFLGHIKDTSVNTTVKRARSIKGRTPLAKTNDDAIAFPTGKFEDFYMKGLGGAKDPRVALRDKLIVLLMHATGLRVSEALLLWVTDVFEDPSDPDRAIVRIYNEIEGKAPEGWKSRKGIKTRKAYLQEKYSRIPRQEMQNTQHLGWKSKTLDDKDGYLEAYFFPQEFARVFMSLWRQYLVFRASVECHHPYAFINFDSRYLGNPYTYNSFNQNYAAGLRRIGLEPDKSVGLDPHGHRHNYGRRLTDAGVDPLIRKKCLHHASLESQVPYTMPSSAKVSEALSQATQQLQLQSDKPTNQASFDWKELAQHGFEDLDPDGYFTGKNPRLGKGKS